MRSLSCAFWPSPGSAAELEQLASSPAMTRATSGSFARRELRESAIVGAVALGLEPGLARPQLVEALHHDGEVRLGDRLVEPDHDVAFDALAVA